MYLILASTLSALCAFTNALPNTRAASTIEWQSCPELNQNITILNGGEGMPFDCAKLSVPLDYNNTNSQQLELALFKVNATQEPVLGSVIINFGGPGGTGAENLPAWAERMAANIGPQWNLVSWDPRGTGKTIPFDCGSGISMTPPPERRKRDTTQLVRANLTDFYLNGGWDAAELLAEVCYAAMNETGSYISTAFTARDVMQIVDALGEDGLLRYYGWSYGTALGSYLAAMFPDRVERIVLDANVNPHDYQSGTYGDFLVDADKTFSAFITECFANKDDCALAKYTNASNPDDMVNALNLALQPIASNATVSTTAWTTYSAATQLVYTQLYYPGAWPALAETITSLLNGTYDPTVIPTPPIDPYNLGAQWAVYGIRASDALWRTNSSEEYLPVVQNQNNMSSFSSGAVSLWPSARWRMDGIERYWGNFNVKTKHPILYVNGEYDPVTPLINAYNGSQSFEGSIVLAHSGYGHGSVVDPSACVQRHIQAYFLNGTLPSNGTQCEPDMGPWEMQRTSTNSSESGNNSTTTNPSSPSSTSTNSASMIGSTTVLIYGLALAIFSNLVL